MSAKDEKEFLEKCQKRLKMAIDADNHNRIAAIEDLKFINGEMWDASEKKQRDTDRRPCLQVNLLNKFVKQITGEQLQNRVMIKERPEDGQADHPTAKIMAGHVAKIQHKSKFKEIGSYAFSQCAKSGYGAWEVLTKKTPGNPFEKEIFISLIKNAMVVYLDPEPDDQDECMWGFVITKMNEGVFQEKYPDAKMPDDIFEKGQGIGAEHWYDKESVTIARYYVREKETEKMAQMSDGEVLTKKVHDDESAVVATLPYDLAEQKGIEVTILARQHGFPLQVKVETAK